MRHELEEFGYLFIRGFHPDNLIKIARKAILEHIQSEDPKNIFQSGFPLDSGVLDSRCGRGCLPFMEGRNCITHSKAVLDVLEGNHTRDFFQQLLQGPAVTYDYKWLRGVYKNAFTGAHVDNVYMSRGTSNLLTIWTPFGENPLEMGALACVESSNQLPRLHHFQATYGSCDLEAENVAGSGWFTEDPEEISTKFSVSWKTADFGLGDVLIFTSRTIHMSSKNVTDHLRISCDTRWQRGDEPIDARYVGKTFQIQSKKGLDPSMPTETSVSLEQLKIKWNI